jgi:hypothetical protein
MNPRVGLLKAWILLSAAWIGGLNLLLAFIILAYRSVLWGWIDLSPYIDGPRLVAASLVPPLILGIVFVLFALARKPVARPPR